jgi:hypothetical protein
LYQSAAPHNLQNPKESVLDPIEWGKIEERDAKMAISRLLNGKRPNIEIITN